MSPPIPPTFSASTAISEMENVRMCVVVADQPTEDHGDNGLFKSSHRENGKC